MGAWRNTLYLLVALGALVPGARADVIVGCQDWAAWALNAQRYIRDDQIYIVAHGYSGGYYDGCGATEWHPANEVSRHRFGFYAICDALCITGQGTLSYRSLESVGYCGMSTPECAPCWYGSSLDFQTALFQGMDAGQTVRQSFEAAVSAYPVCAGCIQYQDNTPAVSAGIVRSIEPLLLKGE